MWRVSLPSLKVTFSIPSTPSRLVDSSSPSARPAVVHFAPADSQPVNLTTTFPTVFEPVIVPVLPSPLHVTFTLLSVSSVAVVVGLIAVLKPAFTTPGYHSNLPACVVLASTQPAVV